VRADRDAKTARTRWQGGGDEEDLLASAEGFERAIEHYAATGDLRREAVARGSLGVSLWYHANRYTSDFTPARTAYEGALDARRRLGDEVLIGNTLNALGVTAWGTGDLEAAESWYEQARAVRERVGDESGAAKALGNLGDVAFRRNDLLLAMERYQGALDAYPDGSPGITDVLHNLASIHGEFGEVRPAAEMFGRVAALYEGVGDARNAAEARRVRAVLLSDGGHHAEALRELALALTMLEGLDSPGEVAGVLSTRADVYLRLGESGRALEDVEHARDLAAEAEDTTELLRAMSGKASALAALGRSDEALATYVAASELRLAAGDTLGMAVDLKGRADIRSGQDRFGEALQLYRQAAELDGRAGRRKNEEKRRIDIANALCGLGRTEEARQEFARSIVRATANDHHEALWTAYLGMADAWEREAQLDSARAYNELALDTVENAWAGELAESSKTSFVGRNAYLYEAQVHVLAKLYDRDHASELVDESFRVAERAKARALRDLLLETRGQGSAGMGDGDGAEERSARGIAAANARLRAMASSGAPAESLDALRRERDELQARRREGEETRRRDNPRLAALRAGEPVTIERVRETLLSAEDDLLLSYSLGDSASYLWEVRLRDVRLHRLPPRLRVEEAARVFRDAIVHGETSARATRGLALRRSGPAADGPLVRAGRDLARMLLDPVASALRDARRVTIVPDGILHFVPFEALPAASGDDEPVRWVFDGVEVRYGPSATTLSFLEEARVRDIADRPSMDLLAVGDPEAAPTGAGLGDPDGSRRGAPEPARDLLTTLPAPLPYTREEVRAIAALFPAERRTILLGADAQEADLARLPLVDYRILHFATHAIADEREPDRSGLLLSFPDEPTQDGFLQAWEICRWRLHADLVVLSACDTGVGRIVRGEGILSLPRAFFYAGANAVLVSLWPVSDESTARFMESFYRFLAADGGEPGRALALARAELRAKGPTAHPFAWGAFVLMGPG
ncbi:CHAT domain-containing protein, partial [bacterium]|nr:CHAT domain-containing protein [bacterium]